MSSANSNSNNKDESIAGKIQCIQELCAFPNHADAATTPLSDRLMALCHVLAVISEPINSSKGGGALKGLYIALTRLEECLVQFLSMNRVVYMVQALNLQTDLEICMKEVSFHLQTLVESLSPAGQELFQAPLLEYQKLTEQQQLPFKTLRENLQEEQSRLALCASDNDFAAFLEETIGHISTEEMTQALVVLQQNLGALSVQLSKSSNDNKSNPALFTDAAARGKAIQFQGLLGIVVARLQAHPKLQQKIQQQTQSTDNSKETGRDSKNQHPRNAGNASTEYPSWALDPLTGALMTTPVKLRAPCQDIMDKASFIEWMDKGEIKCPVCQGPMTSIAAKPDRELKQRIQQAVLKSHTTTTTKDGNGHRKEFVVLDDRPGRHYHLRRQYSSSSSLAGMSIQEDKAHDTFDESFRSKNDSSMELAMTQQQSSSQSNRNNTASSSSSKKKMEVIRDCLDSATTQKNILSELRQVISNSPSSSSSRRQRPRRFIVGSDSGDKATTNGPRRVVIPCIDVTTGGRKDKPPSSRSADMVTVIQLAPPKSGTTPKFFDAMRRKLTR